MATPSRYVASDQALSEINVVAASLRMSGLIEAADKLDAATASIRSAFLPSTTARVDGNVFFGEARQTLGEDVFNIFLESIKRLNKNEQTQAETFEEARMLFGVKHPGLLLDFGVLLRDHSQKQVEEGKEEEEEPAAVELEVRKMTGELVVQQYQWKSTLTSSELTRSVASSIGLPAANVRIGRARVVINASMVGVPQEVQVPAATCTVEANEKTNEETIDEKPFIPRARFAMSMENFVALLACIKRLSKLHKTRQDTIKEARCLFGSSDSDLDLFADFEAHANSDGQRFVFPEDILYGQVIESGLMGVIIARDPNAVLTYKLQYPGGETSPFAEHEVELIGLPFGVQVETQSEKPFIIEAHVNDTLASFCEQVAHHLGKPIDKVVLSSKDMVFKQGDGERCLGLLGFHEGTAVSCMVTSFNTDTLRLAIAFDYVHADDGEQEAWAVNALIVAVEGYERVLWARHFIYRGGDPSLNAAISSDRLWLEVTYPDGATSTILISTLVERTPESPSSNLGKQLEVMYSAHADWSRILESVCSKIV